MIFGSKYGNKKTVVYGIKFDSKKEAHRFLFLKDMMRTKKISKLELQPAFTIIPGFTYNGKKIREAKYVADFAYMKGGKAYIEDTKGFRTEVYKLKRKMFLSIYGKDYVFVES